MRTQMNILRLLSVATLAAAGVLLPSSNAWAQG
jgi:hypothetical protein